jgi:phospholipase C
MNHDYLAEQKAYNGGLMNKSVEFTGPTDPGCTDPIHKKQVMGYYDGNTVTALWNYAQHYAMNDNSYSSTFGPSTPGHINLISGQTHGANPSILPGYVSNGTLIANAPPVYDACSDHKKPMISMTGRNVGDLLNTKYITWGWFIGGFKLSPNIKVAEGDIYTGGDSTCYGSS